MLTTNTRQSGMDAQAIEISKWAKWL